MIDHQFFPTGFTLAMRACRKFKTPILRLLEPSAGRGDLVAPLLYPYGFIDEAGKRRPKTRNELDPNTLHESIREARELSKELGIELNDLMSLRRPLEAAKVDCVELNLQNQAILREQGLRVVGHDFLSYQGAGVYSHVLLNPPFAQGAEHVLQAWQFCYNTELVAILNAETLRNPCTRTRQQLLKLISQYSASEPEFVEDAFLNPDTERKTSVEVVIIHLHRQGNYRADFIDNLKTDNTSTAKEADFERTQHELMLPKNWIQNQVTTFQQAVTALREATLANVRATVLQARLGRSINRWEQSDIGNPEQEAAERFNKGYAELKERAWSSVLRGTEVTAKLGTSAQKRMEADFASICDLDFSVANIYGFLGGLISMQPQIQIEMLCDVFDLFSAWHSNNAVYYQGWRSNDRHRQATCGMALRTTRIVLPANRRDWYDGRSTSLCWDDERRFADFDKAFAMLDSAKSADDVFGLVKLFRRDMAQLVAGERMTSDYFDVRFYPMAGTFHLFPKRKDLVDRLNRLVGKQRQWLPHNEDDASPAFWAQFTQAEAINKAADFRKINNWRLLHGSEDEQAHQQHLLCEALETASEKLGLHYNARLEQTAAAQLPLLEAA